ncbi:MAG: phosphatidylserine decarboxylase family protein [Desulfobulbaceae bacterium]|nr:phosphatidylserine decarboxylase family protein [Desulfobulbaceae bacterium]
MKTPRVPVAKEGYPYIGFAALMTLIAALLDYDIFSFAALSLTAFVLYFFRDPDRIAPDENDVLVSPADGKIILVEKVFDERFVQEHVYKISIFMNIFNVHVNRMPCPGTVTKIVYSPGKFYSANTERAALNNEYCGVIMNTKSDQRLAVVQVAGLIARRIVCWTEKGDILKRGERFGLIRFGSRVDLYLPLNFQVEVSVGQKVTAGETVMGYLA